MQIYPEKYDKLELSTSERSFIRTMERAFSDNQLAYYVLQINPRKRDSGDGKAELFNLLIVPEGMILFRFNETSTVQAAAGLVKAIGNPIVHAIIENDIKEKLRGSAYLVNNSGELRYGTSICYVLPNIEYSQVESELSDTERTFCSQHVLFKNDIQMLRKEGKSR